jgi:outer membrane protein assembly factor BamD (BamD/ComL family)
LIFGFLLSHCHKNISNEKKESEIELEIMEKGSDYLNDGKYNEAHLLYSQFVVDYPMHPFVDDAAYRLAYITIIADEENPHYDYKNALLLFKNFIENYPNSRYINASQNWINLLLQVKKLRAEQSESKAGNGMNSSEINRLKNELNRVQAENARLKNTLEELQRAIER